MGTIGEFEKAVCEETELTVPDKVKVAGFTVKVKKDFHFPKGNLLGESLFTKRTIYLAPIQESCPQELEQTFIHELIHQIADIYCTEKVSEATIKSLSQGLFQVIKDNQGIFSIRYGKQKKC